jgi:hypothetical protein
MSHPIQQTPRVMSVQDLLQRHQLQESSQIQKEQAINIEAEDLSAELDHAGDLNVSHIDSEAFQDYDPSFEQKIRQLGRLFNHGIDETEALVRSAMQGPKSLEALNQFATLVQSNTAASYAAGLDPEDAKMFAILMSASDIELPQSQARSITKTYSISENIQALGLADFINISDAEKFAKLLKRHLEGGTLDILDRDFLVNFGKKPGNATIMKALGIEISQKNSSIVLTMLTSATLKPQDLDVLQKHIQHLYPLPNINDVIKDPFAYLNHLRLPLPKDWLTPDKNNPDKPVLDLATAMILVNCININNLEKQLKAGAEQMKEGLQKAQELGALNALLLQHAASQDTAIDRETMATLFAYGIMADPDLQKLESQVNQMLMDPQQAEAAVYAFFADPNKANEWLRTHGPDASQALQHLMDTHGGRSNVAMKIAQNQIIWGDDPYQLEYFSLQQNIMSGQKPTNLVDLSLNSDSISDYWKSLSGQVQSTIDSYNSTQTLQNIELQRILNLRHQSGEMATNFLAKWGQILSSIVNKMN